MFIVKSARSVSFCIRFLSSYVSSLTFRVCHTNIIFTKSKHVQLNALCIKWWFQLLMWACICYKMPLKPYMHMTFGTWQTNSCGVKEELKCKRWAFLYLAVCYNNLPDIWCRLGWWATRLCVMNTECFWAIIMKYNAPSADVPPRHGSVMTWCMKLCKNIRDQRFWCKSKARHWN